MKKIFFCFLLIASTTASRANNIQVTNISVNPGSSTIQFTVTWENSWRSSILNNWDAAWVFLKFYNPLGPLWQHLNVSGGSAPVGYIVQPSADNVGAFIYRSATGSGTSTVTDVQLTIPAAQATGVYDIKVFAIEMVNVPQGGYYVGDGSSASGAGRYGGSGGNQGTPGLIGPTAGQPTVYDPLCSSCPGNMLTNLPAAFPSGYGSFYSMKYELSQGGYRDFLNTLTYLQQSNHSVGAPNSTVGTAVFLSTPRGYLEIKTPGVSPSTPAEFGCDADNDNIFDESTDGEWVACHYLTWPDQAAYLAWAGLRPLTELEYEKTCRGIQLPVAGEFAWGNANLGSTAYTFNNLSQPSESVSNAYLSPSGNAVYNQNTSIGPLRNGIFATATSNRITSGGSFYGVMELSGNIQERVVSTASSTGQTFTGIHGNGTLTLFGYSGISTWPGYSLASSAVDGSVNANGLIIRGGNNLTTLANISELRTSYRVTASLITDAQMLRETKNGCRGGRTAP